MPRRNLEERSHDEMLPIPAIKTTPIKGNGGECVVCGLIKIGTTVVYFIRHLFM